MPVQVLSAEEREAWSRFPERIEEDALGALFTLTAGESQAIRRLYGDQNRLAVALQASALRWLGFIPDDLWSAPGRAVSYLAEQLDAAAEVLTDYRALPRTRSEHARVAQRIARFRAAAGNDLARLHWRLLQAALEHDSPLALLREACRWLRSEQIVRPGLTVLERTVSAARMDAERATHRELQAMVDGGLVARLEALLLADVELSQQGRAMTRLAWLAEEGKSGSRGIGGQIAKLVYLRAMGADGSDLSGLNPNRRRILAELARRSTNQALQRRPERVCHPSLVAFCADQAARPSSEERCGAWRIHSPSTATVSTSICCSGRAGVLEFGDQPRDPAIFAAGENVDGLFVLERLDRAG